MKKLKRIFDEFSWIFKIALCLIWVLWAGQLFGPIKSYFQQEIQYQKSRDVQLEKEQTITLRNFVLGKIEAAKEKGKNYSPKAYFEDLKEINIKKEELRFAYGESFKICQLQNLLNQNYRKGFYTDSDISLAASDYSEWRKAGGAVGEKNREEIKTYFRSQGWEQLGFWLMIFYLRSILLSLLLYLVRMTERKGILETILADKRKFVFSILAWPLCLFKYPYNIVREIRVEAELRRLGKVFRKLTGREKKLIQEIANSNFYSSWIIGFHKKYANKFQRGLAITFLVTIMFGVFFSFTSVFAKDLHIKNVHRITITVENQRYQSGINDLTDGNCFENQIVLPIVFRIEKSEQFVRLKKCKKVFAKLILFFKIDHIPISPLGFEV